jgi:phosphoenolpyruvate carboxykinase (GTP)
LKWIVERAQGKADGETTPLGIVPRYSDLNWDGLTFDTKKYAAITTVDKTQWQQELKLHNELLDKLALRMPEPLKQRNVALNSALF